MRHIARAIIAASILLAAPGLHAQALQCVTPEGKTIITDGDCPDGTRVTKFYRLLEPESPELTPYQQNQRALRTWESAPAQQQPYTQPRTSRRPSSQRSEEAQIDARACKALAAEKESIQDRLRYGMHGHSEMERGRTKLRQIRKDQCRQKCIRC